MSRIFVLQGAFRTLYRCDPDERRVDVLLTTPEGREAGVPATRDVTPQNVAEARRQGYTGTDAEVCWRSLVEHEILHSVVGWELWAGQSAVLLHESGLESTPYEQRLYEEAVTIALQRVLNTPIQGTRHADHDLTPLFSVGCTMRRANTLVIQGSLFVSLFRAQDTAVDLTEPGPGTEVLPGEPPGGRRDAYEPESEAPGEWEKWVIENNTVEDTGFGGIRFGHSNDRPPRGDRP